MLKMTVISGCCSGGLVASICVFNVLLNHLNGQLASCERIINISCQGIETVLCPFLPSLWPLLEAPLGGLDTTQCCHLLVILRYCCERSCVQSQGRTAGGRFQSAAVEKKGAAADVFGYTKPASFFCSFLVAWICTIHVFSPPSHTWSQSCLLY